MRSTAVGIAAVCSLALLAIARDAAACGGTFCDSPPPGQEAMPVDQSGENILFVVRDGYVEAHIQIQYTGDPERFAWLVPVPAIPEVSVGSQQLFLNLLNGTVPTFTVNRTFEFCSNGNRTRSGGCSFGGASDEGSGSAGAFDDFGAADAGGAPADVAISKESVGAFDVTILEALQSDAVTTWLQTNGFLQEPAAPAIIQDYIDRGHVFVAVKLQPGAGVDEIHPLVIRYAGSEPCIPLELTAVAATEDMAVRAFFLGDRRVVPVSYRHVTVNPALFDWINFGANYVSTVSQAVDAPGADGRAFITEYAGPSSAVATTGIYDSRWDAGTFRTIAPEEVIDALERQGLVDCSSPSACTALHPLVLPIVRKYLPAPAGMQEGTFYSCLSCYGAQIDRTVWNGDLFADELESRVMTPGLHATEVLGSASYATRLFTTISPDEMTEDPTFANASLSEPPVTAALQATVNTTCEGDQVLELGSGRDVVLEGGQIPEFSNDMPAALAVEEYDDVGQRTLLFDNRAAVSAEIETWNDDHDYPPPRRASDDGGGGCVIGGGPAHAGHIIAAALVLSVLRKLGRRFKARPAR